MKYWFLILSIMFGLCDGSCGQQKASSIRCDEMKKHIKSCDVKKFVGKRVATLLSDPCFKNYTDVTFFDERPGVLSGAYVAFSYCFTLKVCVDHFKYLKQFDLTRHWKFDLLKKETISHIEVIYN